MGRMIYEPGGGVVKVTAGGQTLTRMTGGTAPAPAAKPAAPAVAAEAKPMSNLTELPMHLPKIGIFGGPVKRGYTPLGGYLFAQQIPHGDALFAIDLHDTFSEGSKMLPPERRILGVIEPPMYTTELGDYSDLEALDDYYRGGIWTFHPDMLAKCRHARLIRLADSWVKPCGHQDKVFEVSAFFSHKAGRDGYLIRRALLDAAADYTVPTRFFNCTGQWLGAPLPGYQASGVPRGHAPNYHQMIAFKTKDAAFRSMFHVCIENSRWPGYATEKVMDCFSTCTIPLYWGDPTLSDDFDAGGIIPLDAGPRFDGRNPATLDVPRLVEQVNAVTEGEYRKRLPTVLRNAEIARSFRTWHSAILRGLRLEGLISWAT
jgi:hypothetical protein